MKKKSDSSAVSGASDSGVNAAPSAGAKEHHHNQKASSDSAIEQVAESSLSLVAIPSADQRDDEIIEALRDVVRKCAIIDPLKRPTSAQVYAMLQKYQ